ncbi:hypothetical protein B0H11DRAFT_2059038 [Mycena galericulata]|nr:hypothetical protein B0H11DRAFT_2059038 [Mycena galericulata]
MHESLRVKNLSKLPPALRIRAKRALEAEGTFDDLTGFLARLLEIQGAQYSLAAALPVLFAHLDPARIPSVAEFDAMLSSPDRHPELSRVVSATMSLHMISRMLTDSQLPPAAYVDLWPRLYSWMTFTDLYWDYIPRHWEELSFSTAETRAASAIIILALGQHASTTDVVRKSPGVRAILVRYWSTIVRNDGMIVREGLAPLDGWHDIYSILVFLTEDEANMSQHLDEMVDGVGGSQDELARLLVKQINDAAAALSSDMAAISLTAVLALISVRSKDTQRFNATMRSHGLIPALVNAIRVPENRNHRLDIGHVVLGFGFLNVCFEEQSGLQCITEALDRGLLDLIITLGLTSRQTEPSDSYNCIHLLHKLLRSILPGYLVYYPVAVRLKKHYPHASSLAATADFAKCAIFNLWTDFAKIAEQTLLALDFFESGRWISSTACENMKCLQIDRKSKFKSCAGCSLAYYCSPECQKHDWAAGHRLWCRKLASTHFPGPSSPRDRAYLRALMQYNIRSPLFKPELLIRQAEFIYNHPGVDFFTVLDFTRSGDGPGWIDVRPTSEYAKAPEAPLRLAQLARSGRRMQLHTVVMNGGPGISLLRMFPMWSGSSRLLDGLYRIAKALPPGLHFSDVYDQAVFLLRDLHIECEAVHELEIY